MSGKTTAETEVPKRGLALELLNSLRGRYIVSQALYYGIQELEKVPTPYHETSNLHDMKLLRDELFDFPVDDNSNAIAQAAKDSSTDTE